VIRWPLVLLLLASGLLAADDPPVSARMIDATGDRMPDHTQAPNYPRVARRDRIEGEVQVCFEIDRKGRPRKVAVRRSTNRLFEKPSIKAVKASSFRPIPKGEVVPHVKSCRTFIYSLEPAIIED